MLMRAVAALKAAGRTHPGRQRTVNEDRLHVDASRGLFIVIDGVGGQAAGGKAADVALSAIRDAARTRDRAESRAGSARPSRSPTTKSAAWPARGREWNGMACVATVARRRRRAGDRRPRRRHAAVPDVAGRHREDHARSLARRRAGGCRRDLRARGHAAQSAQRGLPRPRLRSARAGRPEFIDVSEVRFDADSALLLCSDGLTDLVESAAIDDLVRRGRRRPGSRGRHVDRRGQPRRRQGQRHGRVRRRRAIRRRGRDGRSAAASRRGRSAQATLDDPRGVVRVALLVLLTLLVAVSIDRLPAPLLLEQSALPARSPRGQASSAVRQGESIAAALKRARRRRRDGRRTGRVS